MFKFIRSLIWGDTDADLTLEEAYKVLNSAKEEAKQEEVHETVEEETSTEFSCFRRTGVITSKDNNRFMIDQLYEFTSDLQNLDVGSQISFTLYTSKGKVKISDIAIQDDWSAQMNNANSSWCIRSLICKVCKREGRQLTVTPGDIIVDLNTASSEFIPIVGDWMNLEAKVELDENVSDLFGKVLEVQNIRPLRPRILTGWIRQWDDKTKTGVIDRVVFFNKEALFSGYIPIVGDSVITEVIESDQDLYTCRSLKIIPQKVSNKNMLLKDVAIPEFLVNKDGIFISEDVFMHSKKLNETHYFKITLESCLEQDLMLLSVSLPLSNSQCKIIQPTVLSSIVVKPKKLLKFEGICRVRNVGTSRELVLFSFANFCIGRWITVTLESNNKSHYEKAKSADRGSILLGRMPAKINNENLIKGQRPVVPPRFISFKLPEYPVPEKLLNIILKHEGDKRSYELIEDLRSIKNCLKGNISFHNYEERFHTLLFLEEIHELLAMRSYCQDQACFIRNGEYLMLEIENLSERRPSLMVGDRIVAKDAYNTKATEYEGYIHKIAAKHIYIKFAQFFHDGYNGEDMSIFVIASRTVYRRMHQAVGLAVRNLRNIFLFPNKVPNKNAQVNFIYDAYQDSVDTVHKKIADYNEINGNNIKIPLNLNEEVDDTNKLKTSRSKKLLNAVTQQVANNNFTENDEGNLGTSSNLSNRNQSVDQIEESKTVAENCKSQLLLESNEPQKYRSNKISKCNDKPDGIIESLGPFKLEWFNKSLNYYQKEAVRNILLGEARPLPYFIFGPPGTGKTVTLVEIILQLVRLIPHSRLIVGTPSNSAADLIALRLIDSGVLKPGDLVRLVAYRCVQEDMLPVKLIPYCATADIAREGTGAAAHVMKNGLTLGCNSTVIGRHRITVGTCSTLGALFPMGFSKGHFTHIIMDEAGQTLEPEVMIPLSFLDVLSGQVILAGDPQQLGPIVASKAAVEFGFDETYLDRMLNRFPYVRDPEGFPKTGGYDPRLITKLVYNYRSLPDVLVLSSNMFYNGQLISTISPDDSEESKLLDSLKEILPRSKGTHPPPIVFHGVVGENYQTADCPSWFNPNEASQIFYYVNELYRLGLKSTDIGIISPYVKQVRQIRSLLVEAEFEIPKIGTVEEFQGQEFNVIILSTVRSSEQFVEHDRRFKIGFLSNPRRVNVAISRARALMIIVGNPHLLRNDIHWRAIIKHCIENGAYCGCPLSDSD